uniref:Uncharacterized protein n=1 Tax=Rhizophora mucronata TaxID=61149 RepID=A0A2P2JC42_RHIMU
MHISPHPETVSCFLCYCQFVT